MDLGGTADELVLPFASTGVYFDTYDQDEDGAADTLVMVTSSSDFVQNFGQLEQFYGQKGRIEQIQFTDETVRIGSETDQTHLLTLALLYALWVYGVDHFCRALDADGVVTKGRGEADLAVRRWAPGVHEEHRARFPIVRKPGGHCEGLAQ